ncbi:MAG: choice-of-anchor J domain-containing protein [Bacteroidota bacterium]
MCRRVLPLLLCAGLLAPAHSQPRLVEGFEGNAPLPEGWSVWNNASFPVSPLWNWAVRDTGTTPPGLVGLTTRAHAGARASGVSWWASLDTTGLDTTHQADAWLVTRGISLAPGDVLRFWASGGSPGFLDSLQVWYSALDSTPGGMLAGVRLGTIVWPAGSVFGSFAEHLYPLPLPASARAWVGFRYYMDCDMEGLYVHLDDVSVEAGSGVEEPAGGLPPGPRLGRSYPNPFNGSTTLEFRLSRREHVRLRVFDLLGREATVVLEGEEGPGLRRVPWDAGHLASGVYVVRLEAGGMVSEGKLILLR